MFLFNKERLVADEVHAKFKYILCFYSITLNTGRTQSNTTFKYILCFYSIDNQDIGVTTENTFKYILCFYSIQSKLDNKWKYII